MSDLNRIEKLKIEKLFDMGGGYVLDFSNRTFGNFIFEVLNIDAYTENYSDNGDSKANRLRTIWQKESNYNVGKLTSEMLTHWKEQKMMSYRQISQEEDKLYNECNQVAERLLNGAVVSEIEIIKDYAEDVDFDRLAKSIRESIQKNEPEIALDRLHTYLMKYIRRLCEKHKIEFKKEESLNAIFGKYVKFVTSHEKIESQMTERILKYSINIIEAFNDVRNNKSLAHDNIILNYEESLLIFNNITNAIKFIESLEKKILPEKIIEKKEYEWDDDLPF